MRAALKPKVEWVKQRCNAALRASAISLFLLPSAATPLWAQDLVAIILGNDHGIPERDAQSDADTRAVASGLFRAGFEVLNGYNPSPDDVPRGVFSPTTLVIFYSGPVIVSGNDLFLPSDGWTPPRPPRDLRQDPDSAELPPEPSSAWEPLAQDGDLMRSGQTAQIPGWALSKLVSDPFGMSADEVIILIETCHGSDQSIAAPELPQTGAGVFVAYAASSLDCAAALNAGVRLTDFVVRAAATVGQDFAQVLQSEPDIVTLGQPIAPLVFRPGDPGAPPSSSADAAAGGSTNTSAATVTVQGVDSSSLLTAVTQGIPSGATGTGISNGFGGGATQPAVLRDPGFPRPSIIVGLIRPESEPLSDLADDEGSATMEDDTAEPVVAVPVDEDDSDILGTATGGEDVPAVVFDPSNRAAREDLRDSNPDLFTIYLDQGSFDPQDGDFATALQTELRDMNCYRFGIDGDWGPRSRGAIRSYYTELNRAGVESAGEAATQEVFRVVLANGPVRCPDPVFQTRDTPRQPTPPRPSAPVVSSPVPDTSSSSSQQPTTNTQTINPRILIDR